jgi:small-conductance mechanosensitive channel
MDKFITGPFAGEIYGNPLIIWLAAIVVAVALFLILLFVRRIARQRLARAAPETAIGWREIANQLIHRTSVLFLLLLALFAGRSFLDLPEAATRPLNIAFIIVAFFQAGLWGSRLATVWARWYAERRAEESATVANALSLITLFARIAVWSAVALLILDNLGINITTLVAGLGIGGIAIALAAQNILGDLFASVAIVLDKPFAVGDFIIFGDYLGTVEDIGIKTTRIRSLSGEQIIVANTDLLKTRLRNYKRMAERRVLFTIGVTYQTPYEKVEKLPGLLAEIVEAQPQVRFDRAHFQAYGDSALIFEVVYWVLAPDYNLYMDIQQAINLAIYRRLEQEGIGFAYPTRTVHLAGTPGDGSAADSC